MLGRRAAFERVAEVREAFAGLFARPTDLQLVTGEMWPATRPADAVDDEVGEGADGGKEDGEVKAVVMTGVEHLGQYVFEMTKAKVRMLKEMGGKLPALPEFGMKDESDEEVDGPVEEDVDDGSEEDEE